MRFWAGGVGLGGLEGIFFMEGGLDLCWEQGTSYRNISVAAEQSLGL